MPECGSHGSYGFGLFPQFSVGSVWPVSMFLHCWEHALGLSADPSQDRSPSHRHSGGEGVQWTWRVLDPFAHGLQVFLSKMLSRLLGKKKKIKFIVFSTKTMLSA